MTPASGSAGTDTEVTITGSGFGSGAGGDVSFYATPYEEDGYHHFYHASGDQNPEKNINDILFWNDTNIRVRIPSGYFTATNGEPIPISSSSGCIELTLNNNTSQSNRAALTVPFGYKKQRLYTNPVFFVNTSGMSGAEETYQRATDTWNTVVPSSKFHFSYGGLTSVYGMQNDTTCTISIGPDYDFDPGEVAFSYWWGGNEYDIELNPLYFWITSGNADSTNITQRNLQTHSPMNWGMLQVSLISMDLL